jgi:hypothetical protein
MFKRKRDTINTDVNDKNEEEEACHQESEDRIFLSSLSLTSLHSKFLAPSPPSVFT